MKKLISITIIITALLAGTVSVTAQEPQVLTVDRAVHMAIANSENIRRLNEDEILNEIQARQVRQGMFEITTDLGHLGAVMSLMHSDIAIAFQNTNRAAQRALITQSIEEIFFAIINAETTLEFLDRQIAIEQQELVFSRIRHEHGLMSATEFTAVNNRLIELQLEREQREVEIARAYRSLNEIVGSPRNTRHTVILETEFELLGTRRTVENYVWSAISQNADLRRMERELGVSYFEFEAIHGGVHARDSESPSDAFTQRDISLSRSERSLQTAQDALRNQITDQYEHVRQLERNLIILNMSYETSLTTLAINEVRLELGRMTQLEFNTFKLSLDQLRDSIRMAEVQHTFAVERLTNTHLH